MIQVDSPRDELYDKLSGTVGNTPLREILPGIFTKMELENPGGSHYDRAYLDLIRWLEGHDLIRPGDEVRDISSGSAINSLAYVGQVLGYKVHAIVPEEIPTVRIEPAHRWGAEIVRCGKGYMPRAAAMQIDDIVSFSKEPTWRRIAHNSNLIKSIIFEHSTTGERVCFLNHSENLLTVRSFRAIGEEALNQMTTPPSKAVLAIGNGTTLVGVGSLLRSHQPDTELVGVQSPLDATAPQNFGMALPQTESLELGQQLRGIQMMDRVIPVSDHERDTMHQRVNQGLSPSHQLGRSSLMSLVVAERISRHGDGPVLTIGYDSMERY